MKRSISRLALLAIMLSAKVLFAGETSPEGFTPLLDDKTRNFFIKEPPQP